MLSNNGQIAIYRHGVFVCYATTEQSALDLAHADWVARRRQASPPTPPIINATAAAADELLRPDQRRDHDIAPRHPVVRLAR